MPLSFAHPAAALPLARPLGRYGLPSALVIGSLAPDAAYFLELGVPRSTSHGFGACRGPGSPSLCAAPSLEDAVDVWTLRRFLGRAVVAGVSSLALALVAIGLLWHAHARALRLRSYDAALPRAGGTRHTARVPCGASASTAARTPAPVPPTPPPRRGSRGRAPSAGSASSTAAGTSG